MPIRFVGFLLLCSFACSHAEVNFSREVLPILSDRCFHCHGPDESHRKAKLRLDQEEDAKRNRDGSAVIMPGDVKSSALWHRITATNKDELMPPPDSHRKPLSKTERETIHQWILEGAKWGKHWAFEKPSRPMVPKLAEHPVDAFVRHQLHREGLKPSFPAESHTQLRRLALDLTGLPLSPEELTQFSGMPWNHVVDELLASPHHGERLAMWWLDAARYSDTDGYQGDAERTNWPWRDWVIQAFNNNMPFDQFTIEQFAGDLLPDATADQILATCFHRNHMTNGEGGRHPEESRIDYVIDRVNTTGTVWLGLTLGCTQCHSHKFDPISHEDYYSMFAFFNSIDEDGKAGNAAKPYLKYQSSLAPRAVQEMEAHVAHWRPREAKARVEAENRFATWLDFKRRHLPKDYDAWQPLEPSSVVSAEGTEFQIESEGIVQTHGPILRQDDYRVTVPAPAETERMTGWKLEVLPHESHTGGKLSRGSSGEFILTNVKLLVRKIGESQVRDIEIKRAVADFEKDIGGRNYGKIVGTLDDDPRNGWTTETGDAKKPHAAVFELAEPLTMQSNEELIFVLFHRSTIGDANTGRFRISTTREAGETVRGLERSPIEDLSLNVNRISKDLHKRLLDQFLVDDTEYQTALAQLNEAKRQLGEAKKALGEQSVMVLKEREEKRDSHVLVRGVWDAKGEKVSSKVLPAVLPWPEEKARTRLDLAKWIVSPENPLTARVIVNHVWQMMFGAGLVRTPEDFGLQGEVPTHPELLDWLAVELVESGWDLQHLFKLIATSETYRQSSQVSASLLERDPENRLLARAPRFRMPAWMIRDHALKVSGLLNPAIGGPPVKPWQPKGVWQEIFMGRFTYKPSVGQAQYRRTLYAYWRRSSAPTFLFDSAQRRVCEVRKRLTNTPLQALTLLNDTTMLEASRVLANQAASTSDIQSLAQRVLARSLDLSELNVFEREYQSAHVYYAEHPDEAVAFATIGQQEAPSRNRAPALAAWMTLASMMLNLDEAITHE